MKLTLGEIVHFINQQLLNGIDSNIFDCFEGKSVNKKFFCLLFIQSSAFQIENLILVQLAYCSAVRTNHVIGKNLQLRLGVDKTFTGKQQVSVFLKRINFLSVRTY